MYALRDCQSAFGAAIFALAENAENELLPMLEEADDVARRRLAAYRGSILGNLGAALLATYPVVANIVGLPFFREAARQFVLAHPSQSGDLNEYGGDFGDFLAGYPHAAGLDYLPDVARMEWRVQQVFYAPDPAPADLSLLAQVPAERYGDLCFAVTPACARMDSSWPLSDIWRVNQAGYDGDMAVDFSRGDQVLISRRDGLVYVEAMSAAESALFDGLANQDPLAQATTAATAVDSGFDLGPALHRLVGRGLLLRAQLVEEELRP